MRKCTLGPLLLAATIAVSSMTGVGVAGASKGPAGPHVPLSGGIVKLTAYSSTDGPKSVVILTGAIGDYGEAVRNTSIGSGAKEFNQLKLELVRGTFQLDITRMEHKLLGAIDGHFPTNASTCSGEVVVTATTPIVAGSGTGDYKGIAGSLTLTVTINEVELPPTCPKTDTDPYLAQSTFIAGSGIVAIH